MSGRRFSAVLSRSGRGGGRWVEVPFDVREAFGESRPPVRGTVNGAEFRSRLAMYGGKSYLGLNREVRDAAGIELGDAVEVVLERDDAPREVELPAGLAAALARDEVARAEFERLSFTHRKEYARSVADAKRADTRARRIEKALAMLRARARG
jgi:Bacteriocin-protection, YdeI or OmpD-Associated/Domain of unknown function (DUF1905)